MCSVCAASKASVAMQVETLKADLHQQAAALRMEKENAIHEVDSPLLLQICCVIPNNSVCTQTYCTGITSAPPNQPCLKQDGDQTVNLV